jgi:hypothetical protein
MNASTSNLTPSKAKVDEAVHTITHRDYIYVDSRRQITGMFRDLFQRAVSLEEENKSLLVQNGVLQDRIRELEEKKHSPQQVQPINSENADLLLPTNVQISH